MAVMRKYLVSFLCIVGFDVAARQEPARWKHSVKKISGRTYEVHLTATLKNGWHTYSQSTAAGGPAPTKISFQKNPLVVLAGSTREVGQLVQKHEEVFKVDVKYFSGKVDFVQVVTAKSAVKTTIAGTIEFMVCTDEQCLLPATVPFSVAIN
jgi:DsbC/DsbD-like thiol-disulfide interchange protein